MYKSVTCRIGDLCTICMWDYKNSLFPKPLQVVSALYPTLCYDCGNPTLIDSIILYPILL